MLKYYDLIKNGFKRFSAIFIFIGLLVISLFLSNSVLAQNKTSKLYQIKAGFLLQFASFVEWPHLDSTVIHLCIVGEDPFGNFIDNMLLTKPIARSGNSMRLVRKSVGDNVSACQIIFITKISATKEFWRSLPSNHSILLVSEYESFTKNGGIINYYEENNRIRLEINQSLAINLNITISSELLKLARITPNEVEAGNK